MKIGGQSVLSSSFLKDSDSIHRKNRMAGEISTSTEKPKPILPTSRRSRYCPALRRRKSLMSF
jgi:hypothetical protein